MSGEINLNKLIASMKPELISGRFVFCTTQDSLADVSHLAPIATYKEAEGLTLIIEEHTAKINNLDCSGVFKCITLTVHSSLDAVGLTAAFSNELAKNNISANVFAGYYHDHIFVAEKDADNAVAVLNSLSQKHK